MAAHTVDAYFDPLKRELSDLPPEQRRDLVEGIRSHVEDALATTPDPSEAEVRNVLEQLGEPAGIAEEARQRFGISRTRPTWREWTAVVLLATGALLMEVYPILGPLAWLVTVVLVVTSTVWTPKDKAVAVLAFPIAELVIVLLIRTGTHSILPVAMVLFGIPLLFAVYLGYRLRR